MDIKIIGNGAVGSTLKMFNGKLSEQLAVCNQQSAISNHSQFSILNSQLFILAVPDRAIAEVAAELPQDAIVLHTSGTTPMNALPQQHRGVLYPLQTFSREHTVDLAHVPLLVEWSTEETKTILLEIARTLSDTVLATTSETRARAHLAAVFANNFTNRLLATATRLMRDADLPPELLHPLILETLRKALSVADPSTVQTGPAARGDHPTIARHLEMLTGSDRDIYETITNAILNS